MCELKLQVNRYNVYATDNYNYSVWEYKLFDTLWITNYELLARGKTVSLVTTDHSLSSFLIIVFNDDKSMDHSFSILIFIQTSKAR